MSPGIEFKVQSDAHMSFAVHFGILSQAHVSLVVDFGIPPQARVSLAVDFKVPSLAHVSLRQTSKSILGSQPPPNEPDGPIETVEYSARWSDQVLRARVTLVPGSIPIPNGVPWLRSGLVVT